MEICFIIQRYLEKLFNVMNARNGLILHVSAKEGQVVFKKKNPLLVMTVIHSIDFHDKLENMHLIESKFFHLLNIIPNL
jgi:hypothetical protein